MATLLILFCVGSLPLCARLRNAAMTNVASPHDAPGAKVIWSKRLNGPRASTREAWLANASLISAHLNVARVQSRARPGGAFVVKRSSDLAAAASLRRGALW